MVTIVDKGNARGLVGSKGITCEGLPTGETILIKDGVLTGLLSDWYEYQRMLNDPKGKEKLGVSPAEFRQAMIPRNGFRFSLRGGRSFDTPPESFATNIVFESRSTSSIEDFIKKIKKGILLGRLWYTYPVNGLRAGDFTSTVTADSYLIEDGRIKAPIKVNTMRVNENIRSILMGIRGITRDTRPTLSWGGDQIMYAPVGVMVEKVHFDQIAEFMDGAY